MKMIFTAVTALFLVSAQLYANTFKAPEVAFSGNAQGYQLVPEFSVEVKGVYPTQNGGVARILLNGKLHNIQIKLLSRDYLGMGEFTSVYEAVLKTDTITESACDEYDTFVYKLKFEQFNEYGHSKVIQREELVVTHGSSWDVCHSPLRFESYQYLK